MLVSGQFTGVYFFSVFVKDLELVSSLFESSIVINEKRFIFLLSILRMTDKPWTGDFYSVRVPRGIEYIHSRAGMGWG